MATLEDFLFETSNMSSNTSLTSEEEKPLFDEISVMKTAILGAMFVVAFIGNILVLLRIFSIRPLNSINMLIANLGISDLIVTFFCNVTDAVWVSTVQWYAGTWACKLIKYTQLFGLYMSTYTIVIIGVDRCLAVLDPLSRCRAKRRVRIHIAAIWLLSAFLSVPQLFIFRVERGPFREDFYQCVTFGAYTARWQEQLYSSLSVLLMYVIPLVVMVTSYSLILCTVIRKSHASHTGSAGQRIYRKATAKSLRLTALIVAAFIICWTPYQVVLIIHTFIAKEDIEDRNMQWIFFFGMANSMVNPLIYGAHQLWERSMKKRHKPDEVLTLRHHRSGYSQYHSHLIQLGPS